MSRLTLVVAQLVAEGGHHDIDDKGYTSANPILPPIKELIFGSLASLIVFAMLYKLAWPQIAKAMKARTARIQAELDGAAETLATAAQQATTIRAALGDIEGERARILADADAQAEALLASGRARLEQDIADLNTRADADLASARLRGGDDLRHEIARYTAAALDDAVGATLDDAVQHDLIEQFIARVGANGAPV